MATQKIVVSAALLGFLHLFAACGAFESPRYTIVHEESDFEVRLYGNSTWISAPVRDLSFEKATLFGYNRLLKYFLGANLNGTWLDITLPVVTSIVPGAGPFHSSAYYVSFYLPAKFQATPPVPLPELGLKSFNSSSHYVAVRKFSGFALDNNVAKQAEALARSLSASGWANATSSGGYSIAQYSPPLQIVGRMNEVWVDVVVAEEAEAGVEAGGDAAAF